MIINRHDNQGLHSMLEDGSCYDEKYKQSRTVGDYDWKQVSMGFTEKVMFEHRLEGRRVWPSEERMFQAEEPAHKELGRNVPGMAWEHPGGSEAGGGGGGEAPQELHRSDPL